MKIAEKTVGQQIRFWSLLGPSTLLLSLIIYFLHSSHVSYELPAVGILGMILSWKWRFKGLIASYFFLIPTAFHILSTNNALDHYWMIGWVITVGVGFLITSLSAEEIDHLITSMDVDSSTAIANFNKATALEEKHLSEKKALLDEGEYLQEQLLLQQRRSEELQNQLMASQQDFIKEQQENLSLREVQQQLKLKLQQTQSVDIKEERMMNDAIVREMGDLVDALNKEKEQLEQYIQKRDQDLQDLRELFNKQTHTIEQQQSTILNQQATKSSLEENLQAAKSQRLEEQRHNEEKQNQQQLQIDQWKQQWQQANQQLEEWHQKLNEYYALVARVKELENDVQKLTEQNQALNQVQATPIPVIENPEVKQFQGMYKQLRQQFDEKNLVLDDARKELFHTQHRLEALQKDFKELQEMDREGILKAYERHILRMQRSWSEESIVQQREISQLETMIEKLLETADVRR